MSTVLLSELLLARDLSPNLGLGCLTEFNFLHSVQVLRVIIKLVIVTLVCMHAPWFDFIT